MLLCDAGVRERDRKGWKFGSPPLLVHPGAAASMLEGDSTITSSGSGGAPGSPGLGRLEEVVEEATPMLAPATDAKSPLFCSDGKLSEPITSEVEGLRSPSGWKSRVELFENVEGKSQVVVRVERLVSQEELEAPALRASIFSFLVFCTSSVILVMMKFCERNSLMDSIKESRPRGFSASMSNNMAVLLVCVVLQLISSASSRVRILRERRKSRWRSARILSQR